MLHAWFKNLLVLEVSGPRLMADLELRFRNEAYQVCRVKPVFSYENKVCFRRNKYAFVFSPLVAAGNAIDQKRETNEYALGCFHQFSQLEMLWTRERERESILTFVSFRSAYLFLKVGFDQ